MLLMEKYLLNCQELKQKKKKKKFFSDYQPISMCYLGLLRCSVPLRLRTKKVKIAP